MKPLVLLAASFLAFFLVVQCQQQITVDVLSSDRQALLEFDASVHHLRDFGWNESVPVCNWFGITCRKDQDHGTIRVVALRLPGVGLYGVLPDISKLDALKVLSLRSNRLVGRIPSNLPNNIRYLYLQHNSFSGDMPRDLSPQLRVIDLSGNSLTGEIPSAIKNLTRLTLLNLQFNSFSGAIPDLHNMPKLEKLNVSHNLFNGTIPESCRKFPVSSFVGNPLLCGPPLATTCKNAVSPAPLSEHTSRKVNVKSIVIGGSSSIVFLVILAVVLCCYLKKKKKKKKKGGSVVIKKPEPTNNNNDGKKELVFFEGCGYNFNLKDLLRGTAQVLGKGSYGTTYRAIMVDDDATTTVVAVKWLLREATTISKKEFEQHMEVLKSVGQHPSIVPLRAYYYSEQEKFLFYDYMLYGSFSDALHGTDNIERVRLDWETRVRICLGVARGISHIHSSNLLHGNIKASNVLLTKDLQGCISDVCLYPLMSFPCIKSPGVGYYAPEAIETQKSDVYSFGVLLLETLTRKTPVYTTAGLDHVIDLPRWVRSVVDGRDGWNAQVFDAELLKHQNVEVVEMLQMMQIALSCVDESPDSRPTIHQVVQMMEDGPAAIGRR